MEITITNERLIDLIGQKEIRTNLKIKTKRETTLLRSKIFKGIKPEDKIIILSNGMIIETYARYNKKRNRAPNDSNNFYQIVKIWKNESDWDMEKYFKDSWYDTTFFAEKEFYVVDKIPTKKIIELFIEELISEMKKKLEKHIKDIKEIGLDITDTINDVLENLGLTPVTRGFAPYFRKLYEKK